MTVLSHFAARIASGAFTVTAGVVPPADADATALVRAAEMLEGKVDAAVITDGDGARMGALAACVHVKSAGVEPILGLSTRDMNRVALAGTVIGAASLGIGAVVCAPGTHQSLADNREARGVFDIDPIQLLSSTGDVRPSTGMIAGTVTNPSADPIELHLLVLDKAVRAGATFVITSSVFDAERFAAWMEAVREKGLHERLAVIAGVLPFESRAEAETWHEKTRAIDMPERILDQIGPDLAAETARTLAAVPGVRGIHIHATTPERAVYTLEAAGMKPAAVKA